MIQGKLQLRIVVQNYLTVDTFITCTVESACDDTRSQDCRDKEEDIEEL